MLNEPEQAVRTVSPWILEKLKEAVEKNDMQIIEKLIGMLVSLGF